MDYYPCKECLQDGFLYEDDRETDAYKTENIVRPIIIPPMMEIKRHMDLAFQTRRETLGAGLQVKGGHCGSGVMSFGRTGKTGVDQWGKQILRES